MAVSTSDPISFGRYQVLRRLGSGGMGEVWLARARGPERVQKTVVVKRLRSDRLGDESARARFVEEARVAVALTHPRLVPVFDFGDENGEYFLVMEFVGGGDLQRIAGVDRSPLGWESVALVGSEICDALAYVHTRKDRRGEHLVHGDVTPHNILLSPEGHALLGDFGLTRFAPHDRAGTRRYQAPEQVRGQPFDGRADLYSLALLLCETATGSPAYDRDSKRAAEQARVGILPPLDSCDAALATVLRRALSAAPEGRFATAAALRDQFDALLDREPRARNVGRAELVRRIAAAPAIEGAPSSSRLALTEGTRDATKAPSTRRWLWVSLLLVPLSAAAWLWLRPSIARVTSADPPRMVLASPPAATSPVTSQQRPELPPSAPSPAVASRAPRTNRAARAPSSPATATSAPPPLPQMATLDLNATPWAHVRIDGRDLGDTPLLSLELTAGSHRVELINEPLGIRREVVVELHPGEHARRVERLSPESR